MATDLFDELATLATLMDRVTSPITADAVRSWAARSDRREDQEIDDGLAGSDVDDPAGPLVETGRLRRHRALPVLVGAAAATVLIVLLVVVTTRPRPAGIGVNPPTPSPGTTAVPVVLPGRLVAGGLPAGWRTIGAGSDPNSSLAVDPFVERVYADSTATPELGPSFLLWSVPAGAGEPGASGTVERVTVRGIDARLVTDEAGRAHLLFGPLDGYRYELTGNHVTRDQLLAAAATVRPSPDGFGAVIDPSALPAGIVERAVGVQNENVFIDGAATGTDAYGAHWTDGTRNAWYLAIRQDPALFPLQRLNYDHVTDVTINGHAGFLGTIANTDEHLTAAAWTDGTFTYVVTSADLSAIDLEAFATSLHPATSDEWATEVEATTIPGAAEATTTAVGLAADSPNADASSAVGDGSASVWAPVHLTGMTLIDVSTGVWLRDGAQGPHGPHHLQRFSRSGDSPATIDLTFGDPSGQQVGDPGGTVHGQPAVVAPAVQGQPMLVWWIESGQLVTAHIVGIDAASALQVLDSMAWNADPDHGFRADSAGAGFVATIDRHIDATNPYTGYVILLADGTMVRVEASTDPQGLPASADDTAVPGVGHLYGQLLITDDSTAIQIGFWPLGQNPTHDQIQAIAESFAKVTPAQITELANTASNTLRELPELSTDQLGSAQMVWRGKDAAQPLAGCLRIGDDESCHANERRPGVSINQGHQVNSYLVNGTWMFVAENFQPIVDRTGNHQIAVCTATADGTIVAALDGEQTKVGDHLYLLTQAPADAEYLRLCTVKDGQASGNSTGMTARPTT